LFGQAPSVVGDVEVQGIVPPEPDPAGSGVGVPGRVGDGLGGDPIRGHDRVGAFAYRKYYVGGLYGWYRGELYNCATNATADIYNS
jgi:hypothetical protein